MIMPQSDCLVFETSNGEAIPCPVESVATEIIGEAASGFDPEFLHHVSAAVRHYFQHELNRGTVSVAEFTDVLAKVLRGLGLDVVKPEFDPSPPAARNLRDLADDSVRGFELAFFERLRGLVRREMRHTPAQLRFTGLRDCVKSMLGARRWGRRCQVLNDDIVFFLRRCFVQCAPADNCSLLVQ